MIVPGRDVAAFAPAAIASLQAQSEPRSRALLIDDGPRDGTATVFAEAAASDPRFDVVHHREARGLGAARNVGLERAHTPFIGFLDADDALTPQALTLWLAALRESGSDFVAGAYVRSRPSAQGYAPG